MRKKKKKLIANAILCIKSTPNNTLITAREVDGSTIFSSSCGTCGFKGTAKTTPYAFQKLGEDVNQKLQKFGVKSIGLSFKGEGLSRQYFGDFFENLNFKIIFYQDIISEAHNGCRPPKIRKI
jgi:small subunit ribosomal protein S11